MKAPQPALGKRETNKRARKEAIYQVAVELFRRQGFEATRVEEITEAAGVAKGTFFNYFPTKDAVLRYMGAREIGRLGVASLAGGSTSAVGNLKRFMAALATGMERDRELVKLIFARGMTAPDMMCGDAGGFSVQPTTALLIRRAQHLGEINRDLDADALAAALDALYLQQLVRWCEAETPYVLGERLTGIVDLLMMGIAAR